MHAGWNLTKNNQVKTTHFINSDLLWDHLIKIQRRGNHPKTLIFRGHANAEWRLIPTIYRFKPVAELNQSQNPVSLTEQQLKEEFNLLKYFIYGCDEVGVSVPNDLIEFRNRNLSEIN